MQIELRQSRASPRAYPFLEPRVSPPVRLRAVATAVPGRAVTQAEIVGASEQVFDGRLSDIQRLLPVFAHAGIETRHFCLPIDWYMSPHSWAERNQLFVEHAVDLLVDVAERTL